MATGARSLRILFVCAGNTGRSVSAESAARRFAAERGLEADFFSRGVAVDPGSRRVESHAERLWRERGVDLSAHRAEQLGLSDVIHADLILTVAAAHKARAVAAFPEALGKIHTLAEYSGIGGDIADAFGKPRAAYERMLADVERQVRPAIARAMRERAAKAR